jgi:hypothetical protein
VQTCEGGRESKKEASSWTSRRKNSICHEEVTAI